MIGIVRVSIECWPMHDAWTVNEINIVSLDGLDISLLLHHHSRIAAEAIE